jgi:hypothetical protein
MRCVLNACYSLTCFVKFIRKELWNHVFYIMSHKNKILYENKVLRKIFGPKNEEVTKGWRKLHNDNICNFLSSLNIIRVI